MVRSWWSYRATRGTAPSLRAQPGDDCGQDAGELRVHQQQPFLVALGGHDLQQGHDFAAAGQPVGHQRQVSDLEQFFQAYY